jgi:hypothetical protein
MAELCHTLHHVDRYRFLSKHTTCVSTSASWSHPDLCAAYGDRHREAALENNVADLHPRRRA